MAGDFIDRLVRQEQGCAEDWLRRLRVALPAKDPSQCVEEVGIRWLDVQGAEGKAFGILQFFSVKSELVGDGVEELRVVWAEFERGLKVANCGTRVSL